MSHSLRSQPKTVRNCLHSRRSPRRPITCKQLILKNHQQRNLPSHRLIPLRRLRRLPQRLIPSLLCRPELRRRRRVRNRQIHTLPRQHNPPLTVPATMSPRIRFQSIPRRTTHNKPPFVTERFQLVARTISPSPAVTGLGSRLGRPPVCCVRFVRVVAGAPALFVIGTSMRRPPSRRLGVRRPTLQRFRRRASWRLASSREHVTASRRQSLGARRM